MRAALTEPPHSRHATAADAVGDPEGPGYGWGDDDRDVSFNEDPIDGGDNDNDGLVDEDPEGPPRPLPISWLVRTFSYDADNFTETQRSQIPFIWDPDASAYFGDGPAGATVTAASANRRFTPVDWL
ncbi:uncharacterized protein METZ01_LOCUS253487, partial [marine metagenome]